MRSRSRPPKAWGSLLGSALHAFVIFGLLVGDAGFVATARAAEEGDAAGGEVSEDVLATPAQLEELVGPIALYPDELLAITLPASTYPLQIVQASRFLEKRKSEPDLEPDEEWDPSVLGLLNYPETIQLLNDDLNWTWELGEAVANQQDDVMGAVQSFRARVEKAGNLQSNEQVNVVNKTEDDQQIIVIESASPEVIYVPSYQPSTVVVVQSAPYPYYYSPPYPYYYNPAAAFWTGMFVGAAIGYGMSWGRYGHYGHGSINVNRNVNINVNNPGNRPGTNPGGGKAEAWKADKGGAGQSGARPGGDRASTSSRASAAAGDRSTRQASATSRASTADRSQRTTASSSRDRSAQGRDLTSPSASRSSRSSSVGSYKSGAASRSYSSRGHSSRSSGRSGGGRSRGGGGRRR